MTQRTYTLAEIDRMRAGIQQRNMPTKPGMTIICPVGGTSYEEPHSVAANQAWMRRCEDELRTAMIGGVDPAEFPDASESNEH